MDWFVFIGGVISGAAIVLGIWAVWWNNRPPDRIEFERRPIEPRGDAQIVTRDPERQRRPSRVSTAHMSQPRKEWNKDS